MLADTRSNALPAVIWRRLATTDTGGESESAEQFAGGILHYTLNRKYTSGHPVCRNALHTFPKDVQVFMYSNI